MLREGRHARSELVPVGQIMLKFGRAVRLGVAPCIAFFRQQIGTHSTCCQGSPRARGAPRRIGLKAGSIRVPAIGEGRSKEISRRF
jgi:hypothetical protein